MDNLQRSLLERQRRGHVTWQLNELTCSGHLHQEVAAVDDDEAPAAEDEDAAAAGEAAVWIHSPSSLSPSQVIVECTQETTVYSSMQ